MCKRVEIIGANGNEWYSSCIGKVFEIQSGTAKRGRGMLIVRLKGKDQELMNGYPYGWVSKSHCKVIREEE